MEHRKTNGHHNLYFPGGKISIHTREAEFQPAAHFPTFGSQDFCLIVDDDLETFKQELENKGIKTFLIRLFTKQLDLVSHGEIMVQTGL